MCHVLSTGRMNGLAEVWQRAVRRGVPWLVVAVVAVVAGRVLVVTRPGTFDHLLFVGEANDGNVISGITRTAAEQVVGRAKVLLLAVGGLAFARALLVAVRRIPRAPGRLLLRVLARPELVITIVTAMMFLEAYESVRVVRDGHTYLALTDDAFISLRYAANLAHGKGLVFNPGERVEGYTNFLHVVLCAIPIALGITAHVVPLVVLVTSYVLVGLTGVAILATARSFRCPTWAGLLAALAFVLDCNTISYAVTGLETTLLAFVVAASVWAAARRRSVLPFVLLGLLPLVRSDGGLLDVVLLVSFVLSFRCEGRSVRWAWLALALPIVHVLFRRAYYGEWLPNTYYLKMLDLADRLPLGLGGYGFRIAWFYGIWFLLAAGTLALPRLRWLSAGALVACILQSVYAIWVGGDAFWLLRFVAPTLPMLYLGGARFLGALRLPTRRELEAPILLAFGIACVPVQALEWRLGWIGPHGSWALLNVDTAAWMEANVKPGTLSTVYPAGYVPYLAPHVDFVDLLGKVDHHIAHRPSYESLAIGHNRFDFDYVYDVRKPDLAFVDRGCWDFEVPLGWTETERANARKHDPIHSPAWDVDRTHPTFLRLYARNPIHYVGPEPMTLGCIFAREGADVPQFWGPTGDVPRTRTFRYAFDGTRSDQRVALAGHLQKPSKDPVAGAVLDAWVALDAELVVDACASADTALPLEANGAAIPVERGEERAGCTMLRWRIPAATLGARPAGLRMGFPDGAPLLWVEGSSG